MLTLIIIRKKWAFMLVGVIGLFLFAHAIEKIRAEAIATMSFPASQTIIAIDPGHGGIDPGAVGKDGTLEKEINLQIALFLKGYLEQSGAQVVMTRETDVGLYSDAKSLNSKKTQDLKKRKEIVMESGAQIFITIHLNSFPQAGYYGAQTFYSENNVLAKDLAHMIQAELIATLDNKNTRVPLTKENVYVIKDLKIPAVLVECGFLSNPEEREKLKDRGYQKKIAWAIFVGIQRYLGE